MVSVHHYKHLMSWVLVKYSSMLTFIVFMFTHFMCIVFNLGERRENKKTIQALVASATCVSSKSIGGLLLFDLLRNI